MGRRGNLLVQSTSINAPKSMHNPDCIVRSSNILYSRTFYREIATSPSAPRNDTPFGRVCVQCVTPLNNHLAYEIGDATGG